jgi:hypothetical protein
VAWDYVSNDPNTHKTTRVINQPITTHTHTPFFSRLAPGRRPSSLHISSPPRDYTTATHASSQSCPRPLLATTATEHCSLFWVSVCWSPDMLPTPPVLGSRTQSFLRLSTNFTLLHHTAVLVHRRLRTPTSSAPPYRSCPRTRIHTHTQDNNTHTHAGQNNTHARALFIMIVHIPHPRCGWRSSWYPSCPSGDGWVHCV